MVFPYADHDLCGLLGNVAFRPHHSTIKLLMRQILEGMAFIHAVCFAYDSQSAWLTMEPEQLHSS